MDLIQKYDEEQWQQFGQLNGLLDEVNSHNQNLTKIKERASQTEQAFAVAALSVINPAASDDAAAFELHIL